MKGMFREAPERQSGWEIMVEFRGSPIGEREWREWVPASKHEKTGHPTPPDALGVLSEKGYPKGAFLPEGPTFDELAWAYRWHTAHLEETLEGRYRPERA